MAEPLVDASPPLDVAIMASTDGPRLRYLLEEDSNRGSTYEVVCGVVNDTGTDAVDRLERNDVPVERHDIYDFYDECGAELGDMDVRRTFDRRLVSTVADHDPDIVVLVGYLHILTDPFVDRFYPRILNCHHADLTVRDASGPVYTGLRAVEKAVRNGEAATRETVHVVTNDVDTGPIVARSAPFEINRALVDSALSRDDEATLDAYTFAHRRWMAAAGGGPTLTKALELVADGRVTWTGEELSVDGVRGFFQTGDGVYSGAEITAGDDA